MIAVLVVVWVIAAIVDPAAIGLPFDHPVVSDADAWKACGASFHHKPLRYLLLNHVEDIKDLLYSFAQPFVLLLMFRTNLCSRIEGLTRHSRYTKFLTIPICVLLCLVFRFYFVCLLDLVFHHAIPFFLGFVQFSSSGWFGDMYSRSILTAWAYDGMYDVATCALILWLRRLEFKTWPVYLWAFLAIAGQIGWSPPSTKPRPTALTASPHQYSYMSQLEMKAGLEGTRFYDRADRTYWLNAATNAYHGRYRIYVEPTSFRYLTDNELQAEIAHELGHVYYDHARKDLVLYLIFDLYIWIVIGVILSRTFRKSTTPDGERFEHKGQAIPVILFVIAISQAVFVPLQCAISRHKERLADDYGSTLAGDSCYTAQLQAHMSRVEPHTNPLPIFHFLLDGHPSCHERFDRAVMQHSGIVDLSGSDVYDPLMWLKDMRSN